MVERLKIAVEKARALREQAALDNDAVPSDLAATIQVPPSPVWTAAGFPGNDDPGRTSAWNALKPVQPNARLLERNRIISYTKSDPAHASFDVLRTRMLGTLARNGWNRVGITSPSDGCGKTFVSANLAFSLARQQNQHTVLMDMDLRRPNLGKVLGLPQQESLRWFLNGEIPAQQYLRRVGSNLALGLNSNRLKDAAEIIQTPSTTHALNTMRAQLGPDVTLYDLPPMLACDDVMGFLPQLDCVLLVVGGGLTKPSDITECENLLKDQCPILGVILNRADDAQSKNYSYY